MSKFILESYNPNWASHFLEIKRLLWPAIQDVALSIEHVGSTSVEGLAAKPIIDIDIIIVDNSFLSAVIIKLASLGYEHRGNMGIEGREAFKAKQPVHKHNLYVCTKDSIALANHLYLRDILKTNSLLRDEYAKLKFELASKFSDSIDNYIEGKTDFILKILKNSGLQADKLEEIRIANLAEKNKKS